METITRIVGDLQQNERSAVEAFVGHRLRDDQTLFIQIVSPSSELQCNELPGWCNVYEGLTDEQIAEIERSVL